MGKLCNVPFEGFTWDLFEYLAYVSSGLFVEHGQIPDVPPFQANTVIRELNPEVLEIRHGLIREQYRLFSP